MKHEHAHDHAYTHEHSHEHAEGLDHVHDHAHTSSDNKLTHMALNGSEGGAAVPGQGEPGKEHYPWGLKLEVTEAEMKKLGVEELPAVDRVLELEARCKVVASSKEGMPRFTLQITHMDFTEESEVEESAEEKRDREHKALFGNPRTEV